MQAPLQVAFHGLDRSEAIRDLIEEKAAWLERDCDRITGCRVVVEPLHHRHFQGNPYRVRIDLLLPGSQIVVHRDSPPDGEGDDLDRVIRDAFDIARRNLDEHIRRQRGQ
jgi:ribosome-associated translation inhibitor RaiA